MRKSRPRLRSAPGFELKPRKLDLQIITFMARLAPSIRKPCLHLHAEVQIRVELWIKIWIWIACIGFADHYLHSASGSQHSAPVLDFNEHPELDLDLDAQFVMWFARLHAQIHIKVGIWIRIWI